MYSNKPVTPQEAELGASILRAVQLIIENPKEAAAAGKAYAEAVALTEEEVVDAQEARDLIKQAAQLRAELQRQLDAIEEREKVCELREEKADAREKAHAKNVEAHNEAVKAHNTKVEQLGKREKQYEDDKDLLTFDQNKLNEEREAVKLREQAVAKREQAVKEFVKNVGG